MFKKTTVAAFILAASAASADPMFVLRRSGTEYVAVGSGTINVIDCHNNDERAELVRTAHGTFLRFLDRDGAEDGTCQVAEQPAPAVVEAHRPIRRGIATTEVSSR